MQWEAWAPQPQFNHKLLITHGASCGIEHESGTSPSVTSDEVGVSGSQATDSPTTALGLGFAVMSTALDNAGHNCNIATEAESLIMAKEHLIDHYGTLRFTIGTGCSGGSLVQQQVANAYPGVYQGILPQCSFQDALSNGEEIARLSPDAQILRTPDRMGHGHRLDADPDRRGRGSSEPWQRGDLQRRLLGRTRSTRTKPARGSKPRKSTTPRRTRPASRCDLADYMINVFGQQPESMWGPVEKQLGHGFADRPVGNIGVQYGLKALQEGTITPAQFVDINSKIGGVDIDDTPTKQRINDRPTGDSKASTARERSTRRTTSPGVAIIDLRGPDPGAFHDAYRSWSMRARLERDEGHFPKNDVIWFGPAPLIGSPTYTTEGLEAMNRWLDAVEADKSTAKLAEKVANDRPADVQDRCTPVEAAEEYVQQVELPGVGKVCQSPLVETKFATPRVVAGEAITTDNQECQTKPLQRSAYGSIAFTEEQWKALQQAFPSGVCNFAKPGVGQQRTIPWQTYQDDSAGGSVVYGGKPLGKAPANSGEGWTSKAFAGWLKQRSE